MDSKIDYHKEKIETAETMIDNYTTDLEYHKRRLKELKQRIKEKIAKEK